jgi:hypothetical protein
MNDHDRTSGRQTPAPALPYEKGQRPITPEDERGAAELREAAIPAYLYMSMQELFAKHDLTAFKLYRDTLLAECGIGGDPIAAMLVEQLALAHLNAARFHGRAAGSTRLDEVRAYANAAVQLAGEFRRGALALKAYRDPALHASTAAAPAEPTEKTGVSRRTGS